MHVATEYLNRRRNVEPGLYNNHRLNEKPVPLAEKRAKKRIIPSKPSKNRTIRSKLSKTNTIRSKFPKNTTNRSVKRVHRSPTTEKSTKSVEPSNIGWHGDTPPPTPDTNSHNSSENDSNIESDDVSTTILTAFSIKWTISNDSLIH